MNPNLGSNSGMRIFEPRILGPNSGVEFFGSIFSNKKSTLGNSPSRNSPPKIHIKKFTPEFGLKNSHCTSVLQGHFAENLDTKKETSIPQKDISIPKKDAPIKISLSFQLVIWASTIQDKKSDEENQPVVVVVVVAAVVVVVVVVVVVGSR